MTEPPPESASQSPDEYKTRFTAAVALIRKAGATIDAITKIVEASGSLNRLANRREAEFNKWLKNKVRELNVQPEA